MLYQLGALLPRLDIWFQAIQLYPYHADLATPHLTASSGDHRVLGRLLFPWCFHLRSAGDLGISLQIPPDCIRNITVRDMAHPHGL